MSKKITNSNNPQSLKDETKKWYAILKAEGFKDIESARGNLNRDERNMDQALDYYPDREYYYYHFTQYANDETNLIDDFIRYAIKQHCMGDGFRAIADKVNMIFNINYSYVWYCNKIAEHKIKLKAYILKENEDDSE